MELEFSKGKFTEQELEKAVIELFQKEGIPTHTWTKPASPL
jgi:hypothetical protein